MSESTLQKVPMSKIRPNKDALRSVNKKTKEYAELVDSIKARGVLNPVVVRPMSDPETGEEYSGLVDGLHRYTAALDAGLDELPCHSQTMDDTEVLEAQMIGNVHRVDTKPVEYAKQIERWLSHNGTATRGELAAKLGKSTSWLNDILRLTGLHDDIQKLVDEGKIGLSNAYALAKLPPDAQLGYLEQAVATSPTDFGKMIGEKRRELSKAQREGREAKEFIPPTKLRKQADVEAEMNTPTAYTQIATVTPATTVEEAFALGIAWCLQQDEVSKAAAIALDEKKKAEAAEKRERAKQERTAQKAERVQRQADRLKFEQELMAAGTDADSIEIELIMFDNNLVKTDRAALEASLTAEGKTAEQHEAALVVFDNKNKPMSPDDVKARFTDAGKDEAFIQHAIARIFG